MMTMKVGIIIMMMMTGRMMMTIHGMIAVMMAMIGGMMMMLVLGQIPMRRIT